MSGSATDRRAVRSEADGDHLGYMTELSCLAPGNHRSRPCGAGLGESLVPVQVVGLFRRWDERRKVAEPRDVRRCRKCGWYSAFQPRLDVEPAGSSCDGAD